jgi:hypothetical protein
MRPVINSMENIKTYPPIEKNKLKPQWLKLKP